MIKWAGLIDDMAYNVRPDYQLFAISLQLQFRVCFNEFAFPCAARPNEIKQLKQEWS